MRGITNVPGEAGTGKVVVDHLLITASTTGDAAIASVYAKFFANPDLREVILTLDSGVTVTSVGDLNFTSDSITEFVATALEEPTTFPSWLNMTVNQFSAGKAEIIDHFSLRGRFDEDETPSAVFVSKVNVDVHTTLSAFPAQGQGAVFTLNDLNNSPNRTLWAVAAADVSWTADSDIPNSEAFTVLTGDLFNITFAGYGATLQGGAYEVTIYRPSASGVTLIKGFIRTAEVGMGDYHAGFVGMHTEYALPEIFTIRNQTLTFTNDVATISDARVTANSLVDVYYADASLSEAKAADITVTTGSGTITFTASNTPSTTITASVKVTN